MKRMLLVLTMLLASCTSLDPSQKAALRDAAQAYRAITAEMSRDQIIAALGAPQHQSGNDAKWVVQATSLNFESLDVVFKDDDSVRKLTITSTVSVQDPSTKGSVLLFMASEVDPDVKHPNQVAELAAGSGSASL